MTTALSHEPSRVDAPISDFDPYAEDVLDNPYVTDTKRSEVLPEVPTFAEAGLSAMQAVTWFAVVAPPGTPNDLVRELNRVFVDALKLPDVQANFAKRGARVVGSTPQQMDRFVRDETARWAQVIKAAKITVD